MNEMLITGNPVPYVSTELDLDELDTNGYTTYRRLLDKQLCQYVGLLPDENLKNESQSQIINKITSLNIYSLTGKTFKVNNSCLFSSNKFITNNKINGFVFLHTQTANDIDIMTIENGFTEQKIQYSVSDLLLTQKELTIRLKNTQPILTFNAEKCLHDTWIEYIKSIEFSVKPTR